MLASTVFSPTFGKRIQIRRSGRPSRVMTSIFAIEPTPHSGRLLWRTFSPILNDVVCIGVCRNQPGTGAMGRDPTDGRP